MESRRYCALVAICALGVATACGDLLDTFAGFDRVWEVGVSGLRSSYHGDTVAGHPLAGVTTGNLLPVFGPGRVSYPGGVGEVPSPGGEVGRHFDQGVLGWRVDGGLLTLKLATGLDPLTGYYHSGWKKWYGQGDLFLDVQADGGVSHFALLNAWARDEVLHPRGLNGEHFDDALDFHVSGAAGGPSLEGHLVELLSDADVTLTGGTGAYHAGNAPQGLDLRVYAEGGIDRGNANLAHATLTDLGQQWFVQTWTVALNALSSDRNFDVAFHATASCGNDQIGANMSVPEPGTMVLATAAVALACRPRRRQA